VFLAFIFQIVVVFLGFYVSCFCRRAGGTYWFHLQSDWIRLGESWRD